MTDLAAGIRRNCRQAPIELPRRADHELYFVLRDGDDLLRVATWAAESGCDATTFFASDERALEASAFKLYLVLSAPDGSLVILEQGLSTPGRPTEYLSVREAFPGIGRWEQEIAELFGLTSRNLPLPTTEPEVLLGPYPADLYPLRRTVTMTELRAALAATPAAAHRRSIGLPEGVRNLWAGPIHAGIKEAGTLRMQGAGEVIETLQLDPSCKHRGLEKKLETCRLEDGWQLAEVIAGDSSFAHSLAYCQAVESIANVTVPPLAQAWRAALLELERITSHIGNVAAQVHDIALPVIATPMAGLREEVLRLNEHVTASRFLRQVNRPGGVVLQPGFSGEQIVARLHPIVTRFLALGAAVAESPACRDRLIGTGVLSVEEVRRCGASGIIRRASGDMRHDVRLRHPFGVYRQPDIAVEILATIAQPNVANTPRDAPQARFVNLVPSDLAGDDFARMMLRIAEVETSARIIERLAQELTVLNNARPGLTPVADALAAAAPFELGLGCVEGARGTVVHGGISGPGSKPLRWKVTDPSVPALCALGLAASRRPSSGRRDTDRGDIVADVPLDNVSINASPAACAG